MERFSTGAQTPAARSTNRGVLRGLVADAQPLWRATFASMLNRLGVGASAVCGSTAEFDALARSLRPHLVVVDPDGLPEIGECLDDVAARSPHVTIVVVTSRPRSASDVSKRRELREIEEALHQVIAERLDWATLTARELEVLQLVAAGASNRAVARNLWLSDQTVKFHLANAYRKLGVSGRRDAVRRATEIGLLDNGDGLSASGGDHVFGAHMGEAANLDS